MTIASSSLALLPVSRIAIQAAHNKLPGDLVLRWVYLSTRGQIAAEFAMRTSLISCCCCAAFSRFGSIVIVSGVTAYYVCSDCSEELRQRIADRVQLS